MNPATAAMLADSAESIDPVIPEEWDLLEYATAKDALFGSQHIGLGERVYFGFLAQSKADPTKFVVVIRGTKPTSVVEWLEDGLAFLTDHMQAGFAAIYETMECGIPGQSAADGISARVPPGSSVIVIGHSLGAPLGAYLLMALRKMNVAATGMFFAMPKPGDDLFATMFDIAVGPENYMVWNYVRDVVPRLPLWLPFLPFARLHNRIVIRPSDSTAVIPDNVASNHHASSYAQLFAGMKP